MQAGQGFAYGELIGRTAAVWSTTCHGSEQQRAQTSSMSAQGQAAVGVGFKLFHS